MREQFRGHPYFERTERFIDLYDEPAFDPAMECLPLEFFEPMVRRVFLTRRTPCTRRAFRGSDVSQGAGASAGSLR